MRLKGRDLCCFCLHRQNCYVVDSNDVFVLKNFVSLLANETHARRCLIVLLSCSINSLTLWSIAGAIIKSILFFLQNFFTCSPIRQ